MKMRIKFRPVGGLVLAICCLAGLSLGGCQLAYFFGGNGATLADYSIPQKDRVLVMVDSAPAYPMTIQAISTLCSKINDQIYQNKAASRLVPAFRLASLQQSNPTAYRQMTIAQVAAAMHADLVVYVFVQKFQVQLTSARQITRGYAVCAVKVVEKSGKRVWPKNASQGFTVAAHVPPNLTRSQSTTAVESRLLRKLSRRIARIFYLHENGYTPHPE